MDLSHHNRHAETSRRARERIQREGFTMRGNAIWTEEEDQIVRSLYPDYKAIQKALPARSYRACLGRAKTLQVVKRRKMFTAKDLSVLRRLYPTTDRDELLALFPDRNWTAISRFCQSHGIFRAQKPFKVTGLTVLDQIRSRCRELNYTMRDLDKMTRSKQYFSKANWIGGHVHHRAIGRAVNVLFGEMKADWK